MFVPAFQTYVDQFSITKANQFMKSTTINHVISSIRVTTGRRREYFAVALVVSLLAGLPIAVWLDLQNQTQLILQRQAVDLNTMLSGIRSYYSSNVVARVLAQHGNNIQVIHNYEVVPGAIPIPATLSLELGGIVADKQSAIAYRFISDFPFANRRPHTFDAFEKSSLTSLRAKPSIYPLVESVSSGMRSQVRMITPVVMSTACVNCHNAHPESLKHDWKVGDVRGIQEISVNQAVTLSLGSFKYCMVYFLFVAMSGLAFIYLQRRQNTTISNINRELEGTNTFLAAISMKISHYLSPQIYKSIFSGEMDVELETHRKKLTIFFSDIKDFTALTEKLQPEELTALINEYFTEMSAITLKHGGTIDKFIGDAILVFFGDPSTLGTVGDAKACMAMAIEMQHRLAELNVGWRKLGAEEPFQVRMGINTGFCNVGNFGSVDRMDYTILGAEVNLAARLQSIAAPGGIVVSYETYALVRDVVVGQALPQVSMKGLAREVVPYAIQGLSDAEGAAIQVFSEHAVGIDLYLDIGRLNNATLASARTVLMNAISALDLQETNAGNTLRLGHAT